MLVAIYVAQHRRILSSGVRFVQIPCHVNFLKMTIDESRSLDLQPVVPVLYLTVSYLMCTTFLSFLCSTPISRLSKKWKCGCVADSRSATLLLPQSSQVWQTAVRTQKPPMHRTIRARRRVSPQRSAQSWSDGFERGGFFVRGQWFLKGVKKLFGRFFANIIFYFS